MTVWKAKRSWCGIFPRLFLSYHELANPRHLTVGLGVAHGADRSVVGAKLRSSCRAPRSGVNQPTLGDSVPMSPRDIYHMALSGIVTLAARVDW